MSEITSFLAQRDKQNHIFALWALTLTLALVLSLPSAIAFALTAGVAKEIWDYYHPPSVADAMDVLADILGITAATVCVLIAPSLSAYAKVVL